MSGAQNEQDWRENPEEAPVVSTALIVDEVRIVMTDPPRYEFAIDGTTVACSLEDVLNRTSFQARCMAVLHRIPDVPAGKGALQEWQGMVNSWLAMATRIVAPAEASPRLYERAAVSDGIAGLMVVSADAPDAAADFRRGCAVYRKGRVFIRLPSLMSRMRAEHPKMGPDDLADHLRLLGWVSCKIRLSGEEGKQAWYAERLLWETVVAWQTQVAEIDPEEPSL